MASNTDGKLRVVEYTIYLAVYALFATKVLTSLHKYEHGLLGVSTMETRERHRRFPSVSVCIDVDRKADDLSEKHESDIWCHCWDVS